MLLLPEEEDGSDGTTVVDLPVPTLCLCRVVAPALRLCRVVGPALRLCRVVAPALRLCRVVVPALRLRRVVIPPTPSLGRRQWSPLPPCTVTDLISLQD